MTPFFLLDPSSQATLMTGEGGAGFNIRLLSKLRESVGLGLSLLGLSWFYTQFVFGKRDLLEGFKKIMIQKDSRIARLIRAVRFCLPNNEVWYKQCERQ